MLQRNSKYEWACPSIAKRIVYELHYSYSRLALKVMDSLLGRWTVLNRIVDVFISNGNAQNVSQIYL